ncbi:MAG: hypothetical protein NZT61_01220 [Deltaproteobacteria bacterium]|nr:hypothetical protein [Deltaproteobacteria bacterium]
MVCCALLVASILSSAPKLDIYGFKKGKRLTSASFYKGKGFNLTRGNKLFFSPKKEPATLNRRKPFFHRPVSSEQPDYLCCYSKEDFLKIFGS